MNDFNTENLSVGYSGNVLIDGINLSVKAGTILTLIGPNGSGKSTVLRTLTKHLDRIGGVIRIDRTELSHYPDKELAKHLAVVLTDRIRPELMTCGDVVAMGRYPYTGHFGKMTEADRDAVDLAMELVAAADLFDRPFSDISDGQRQRIMLARAICQDPKILVLDEPTSFLDIRHKIELLEILRDMAKLRNVAIIMSLHEIDLAAKISDRIACIDGDRIAYCGTPEEIMTDEIIEKLYRLKPGSYNSLFGSVELPKPEGASEVFVLAGNGLGIPVFRSLQQRGIPFSTGILCENDVDYFVAKSLATEMVSLPPFTDCTAAEVQRAKNMIERCKYFIDCGVEMRDLNGYVFVLREYAKVLQKNPPE